MYRFLSVIGILVILAGCGWRPLYKTNTNAVDMGCIEVAYIPGRDGQILQGLLTQNMHAFQNAHEPLYRLKVTFSPSAQSIGYNAQATVIRTEEQGSATFELRDKKTHALILQETITGSYAYPVNVNNPHTTSLSQERRYLLEYLSHRIISRIAHILESRR